MQISLSLPIQSVPRLFTEANQAWPCSWLRICLSDQYGIMPNKHFSAKPVKNRRCKQCYSLTLVPVSTINRLPALTQFTSVLHIKQTYLSVTCCNNKQPTLNSGTFYSHGIPHQKWKQSPRRLAMIALRSLSSHSAGVWILSVSETPLEVCQPVEKIKYNFYLRSAKRHGRQTLITANVFSPETYFWGGKKF